MTLEYSLDLMSISIYYSILANLIQNLTKLLSLIKSLLATDISKY